MAAPTIPARLLAQATTRPSAPAYHVRGSDGWEPTSWSGYAANVRRVAAALLATGGTDGQVVCILGNNRPEWVEMDLGAMCINMIPAGIYQTCSPEEVAYIINHSEAPIVLVENEAQWAKVNEVRGDLPNLKRIVTMRGAAIDDADTLTWDEFLALGDEVDPADVDARVKGLNPSDPATFIYTSGTTGPPKAVMLSHDNLAWTADTAVSIVDQTHLDTSLSYLPLSHIAEQMFTLHAPITSGASVYFAEGIEQMPDNLKEVQPTVFFGVPRVWEKFHAGISAKLKLATGIKLRLVNFARRTGAEANALRNQGKPLGPALALKYKLANKLIFSKLKPAIGMGNARICVSGAAPIAPDVLEFMASLDVTILEVYGQSEGSGPTTFNIPGRTQFGTVGVRLNGVDVKIADDGEILLKGRNVFLGYSKDAEATEAALDKDGWLYSGDLGAFDDNGFLTITGRKKDIIITAGGKNIAPKNIEAALMEHEAISQAVVIGDRRKFLSALVAINPERAAEANGDLSSFTESIQTHVDAINARFARVEHVRKFTILPRELDQENAELTPTMKIKRRIVNDNWVDAIDAMYAD
ncbi:MAG: AMP-binding protein [Myxococcota bacterium]|nr:AMP-binding protein [Myxococcota bacterium]